MRNHLVLNHPKQRSTYRKPILWLALWLVWIAGWVLTSLVYHHWLTILHPADSLILLGCLIVPAFLVYGYLWWRWLPTSNAICCSSKWLTYLPLPLVIGAIVVGTLLPTRYEVVFRQNRQAFEQIALIEKAATPELAAKLPAPFSKRVYFDDHDVVFYGEDANIVAVYLQSGEMTDRHRCWPQFGITRRISRHWYICQRDPLM